jgi:hypothetical protein
MSKNKFEEMESVRRLVEGEIQKALANRDVLPGSQLERDLRERIRVSCSRSELLVRAVDDSRTLVTPDAFLSQRLGGTVDSAPKRTTGPYRIPKKDSELINASVAEIAAGSVVVE